MRTLESYVKRLMSENGRLPVDVSIDPKRLKQSLEKLHESMRYAYERSQRGPVLPTDWRNRIICYSL